MKRGKKSALLSGLFMGLGQLYNRDYYKGFLFAVFEAFLLIFCLPFFKKGLWGLITLGERPLYYKNGIAMGDHSIILLIQGIITVLLLVLVGIVYIINIRDAKHGGEAREAGKSHMSFTQLMKYIWDKYFHLIMLTPAMISLLFITLLPILVTVSIAFTNYSGPNHLPPARLVDWVGLQNFKDLANMNMWNTTFLGVAKWTIIWATLATITSYFGGLFLALLVNANKIKFTRMWRGIFIIPYAIPGFLSLLVMRLMFSGPGAINGFLSNLGIDKIPWLSDPTLAKTVIILINLWLGAPYFMVLMAGVLTNISRSLYEAADIDGASSWHKFWKITLPMVLFSTAPYLILTFAHNLNNFNNIYILTDGNPVNAAFKYAGHTDILITWIFKMTYDQYKYHMASVITIIIFFIVAAISAFAFSRTKSFNEEDMIQ
jgi:arabinogalactan oligomer/maltooligosaccharide transport system permease protein